MSCVQYRHEKKKGNHTHKIIIEMFRQLTLYSRHLNNNDVLIDTAQYL